MNAIDEFCLDERKSRQKEEISRATLRFALQPALVALRAPVLGFGYMPCARCARLGMICPPIQSGGRVSPSGRGGSGALCAGTRLGLPARIRIGGKAEITAAMEKACFYSENRKV